MLRLKCQQLFHLCFALCFPQRRIVVNSQEHIQRFLDESLKLLRKVSGSFRCGVCVDAVETEESFPSSPAAARGLFDLGCADGSGPAGCQVVGDHVDVLSGIGGEYIVVI